MLLLQAMAMHSPPQPGQRTYAVDLQQFLDQVLHTLPRDGAFAELALISHLCARRVSGGVSS
jgi:hypothetical protein